MKPINLQMVWTCASFVFVLFLAILLNVVMINFIFQSEIGYQSKQTRGKTSLEITKEYAGNSCFDQR